MANQPIRPKLLPNELPNDNPAKRQKTTHSVRKRTLTACESCRIKKIKCDLNKSSCSNCIKFNVSCIYRSSNIQPIIQPKPLETTQPIQYINNLSEDNLKKWSSSNWFSNIDSILNWEIFQEFDFCRKNLTNVLFNDSGFSNKDKLFTQEQLLEINLDLITNLRLYIKIYLSYIQDKNPFMDSKKLFYTLSIIEGLGPVNLFDLTFPSDTTPLVNLVLISACALLTRPLDPQNVMKYKTSTIEKSDLLDKALRYFQLANQLNTASFYKIDEFDLSTVQHNLLKATFFMLNMKPLKAWDMVFLGSTKIITILESFKNSTLEFTKYEFQILERLFYTCLKYECELRVELSPMIPSSGIVNYPFPSIYPTLPIEEFSTDEEVSWFFYLTEISLRKLENRILDELYTVQSYEKTEFKEGQLAKELYSLNWSRWTVISIVAKVEEFLKELKTFQDQIEYHLKVISKAPHEMSPILQPQGVLKEFKKEHELLKELKASKKEMKNSKKSNEELLTPESSDSTTLNPEVPETLQFITTRMIELKLLLFRPLYYTLLRLPREELINTIEGQTFLKNLIHQSADSTELLQVTLATHRHFGSWFYLRGAVLSTLLLIMFYKKLEDYLMPKEKILDFLLNIQFVLNYWKDESKDMMYCEMIIREFIKDIENK
ncbi:hypothetical protein WICMUC_000311 [Wickerhamomyces mucosus]|uniref:Zn(2)-C6 fungal-type domain-containing protein n=1 Tax=Wickerhamomyces mucosus TaxID=1378264 RepID=A0A9P8PY46_9ASCO|nr:hypothetical protein WICMUC_000311 [Wickerhamomyces mucosus]